MKITEGFSRNLAYVALGLALLGGVYVTLSNNNNNNFLKPTDFSKAGWIEFDNSNGRVWDCYANEDIKKNQSNWHLYMDKVREKNKNNLEGKIWLPDLDGNGKVGK